MNSSLNFSDVEDKLVGIYFGLYKELEELLKKLFCRIVRPKTCDFKLV